MLRRYKLKNYNFRLVILLIAISIIGVLLIGSADRHKKYLQTVMTEIQTSGSAHGLKSCWL